MSHDHHNHSPGTVKRPQAPEAELPQAPPGAPEGHDASRAHAERPQAEAELRTQPGTPRPGAPAAGEDGADASSDLEALAAKAAKAIPFVQIHRARVSRELALAASDTQLDLACSLDLARMKRMKSAKPILSPGSANISGPA